MRLFREVQQVFKFLVNFCLKICCQECSKIGQSGHTGRWLDTERVQQQQLRMQALESRCLFQVHFWPRAYNSLSLTLLSIHILFRDAGCIKIGADSIVGWQVGRYIRTYTQSWRAMFHILGTPQRLHKTKLMFKMLFHPSSIFGQIN